MGEYLVVLQEQRDKKLLFVVGEPSELFVYDVRRVGKVDNVVFVVNVDPFSVLVDDGVRQNEKDVVSFSDIVQGLIIPYLKRNLVVEHEKTGGTILFREHPDRERGFHM